MRFVHSMLELQDIHMRFPGVYALQAIDFELEAGEIHALVGENGAGKSTLIKILAGVYQAQQGTYQINGQIAAIRHPQDAIDQGISVVYQELNLVPALSIAENIYFGRLPTRKGCVNWPMLYAETTKVLSQVGLTIAPQTKIQHLSIAAQQLVEIARALSCQARILILDEPTSALSPVEIDKLFDLIRALQQRGVGILYVSHKLEEILALADRVTVLRDGTHVATKPVNQLDASQLITMMVGRQLTDLYPKGNHRVQTDHLLSVSKLQTSQVEDINFHVRAGEVIGFSGLMGSGRTELARAVFGLDKRLAGKINIANTDLPPNNPVAARHLGLGLVPEDRRNAGIFPQLDVEHNMSIAVLDRFTRYGCLLKQQLEKQVDTLVQRLAIRTPSSQQLIAKLSGGNQQKILIARWLIKEDLRILFIDEPTRGIDVGAKAEIYRLLDELASQGLAIVVLSSELPEIMGLCNRIYVMRQGRITAVFNRTEATPEKLLAAAI